MDISKLTDEEIKALPSMAGGQFGVAEAALLLSALTSVGSLSETRKARKRGQAEPSIIPSQIRPEQAQAFIGQAGERISRPTTRPTITPSLGEAVKHEAPDFGGRTEAEQNLINAVASATQGRFSALGIGQSPAAQIGVAAGIAPTLVALAKGQQEEERLRSQLRVQAAQGDTNAAIQLFMADLQEKGIDLDALLKLIGESRPQVVGAQFRPAGPGVDLTGIANLLNVASTIGKPPSAQEQFSQIQLDQLKKDMGLK